MRVQETICVCGVTGARTNISAEGEKKKEEEEEEVEEGGGCLGDDRPHERGVCFGSGMKLNAKKIRKTKTASPILSVISCDFKVGRQRGKGI